MTGEALSYNPLLKDLTSENSTRGLQEIMQEAVDKAYEDAIERQKIGAEITRRFKNNKPEELLDEVQKVCTALKNKNVTEITLGGR